MRILVSLGVAESASDTETVKVSPGASLAVVGIALPVKAHDSSQVLLDNLLGVFSSSLVLDVVSLIDLCWLWHVTSEVPLSKANI